MTRPPAPALTAEEATIVARFEAAPVPEEVAQLHGVAEAIRLAPTEQRWLSTFDCYTLAAAAIAALPPSSAETCTAEHCDRACEDVIAERDRMEDIADHLAYAVAPVEVIGEHSSANNPWQNALDILSERPPPSPAELAVQRVEALADGFARDAQTDPGLCHDFGVAAKAIRAALASPAPAVQNGECPAGDGRGDHESQFSDALGLPGRPVWRCLRCGEVPAR